ncbi:hypothetical protein Scep_005299 [Stephania cephalantha]|uniref:Core Histone H2A/H2B/H3 domain-containing protein n=1 Tax=Stephania cephalantha TaxID=152367 RepID=A0AAP0PXD0_9MAGN
MAPKRRPSRVVVRKTRKVVEEEEETVVNVSVITSSQLESESQTAAATTTTQDEETEKVKENIVEIPVQEGPASKAEAVVSQSQNKRKNEGKEKGKEIKEGSSKKGRKKKKKKRFSSSEGYEGYQRYLSKVLKQVHPELGVSSKAMAVLNGFMNDMFERLANEAAKLSVYAGKTTLSSREIQDAVRLVLPGELGKHAMVEGTKAVSTYMSNVAKKVQCMIENKQARMTMSDFKEYVTSEMSDSNEDVTSEGSHIEAVIYYLAEKGGDHPPSWPNLVGREGEAGRERRGSRKPVGSGG